MNGEELKQYIKRSGMSVAAVAEKLGTSPQNLNAKFNRKSIKIDFCHKLRIFNTFALSLLGLG